MVSLKALGRELKLTVVSLAYHCRRNQIETFRRLPEHAIGGQMCAHVVDRDAQKIRDHYAARLESLNG